jgi:hypothetical protein
MSAPAARQSTRMGPEKGDKSGFAALKSIETGVAVSCREIPAVSELRCAGFEHHP